MATTQTHWWVKYNGRYWEEPHEVPGPKPVGMGGDVFLFDTKEEADAKYADLTKPRPPANFPRYYWAGLDRIGVE